MIFGCLGPLAVFAALAYIFFRPQPGLPNSARMTLARNDETLVAGAVEAYFNTYHKYPVSPSKAGGLVVFGADNNDLIDVLLNRTAGKNGNALNPKGIPFLPAINGLQPSGVWLDPWGSPYRIAIDTSGKSDLNDKTPIPGFYSDVGPLKTDIIIWSYGKNGEAGGGPAKKPGFSSEHGSPGVYAGSSDVGSW